MDKRNTFHIKIDAGIRTIMHRTLSSILPIYTITEYQKSGGTWVGQMISDYLDLPFPRNRIPSLKKQVLHGHLLPSKFMKNVICVFRDGRDATISSYYHMLFESDKNSPMLVKYCRNKLKFSDYNDIKSNLPPFIQYLFTEHHQISLTRRNQFTWNEFVDSWFQTSAIKVKYEDLSEQCLPEMEKVISNLIGEKVDKQRLIKTINKYSFKVQTNRNPGEENSNSFLRRGKPGEWKEKFNQESAEMFDKFAGKQLIKLGYEFDNSWITSLD